MNKYRVVLIPKKEQMDDFYNIIPNAVDIATDYLMAPGRSLPHITLISCNIEESNLLQLWGGINHFKDVPLSFTGKGVLDIRDTKFVELSVDTDSVKEIQEYVLHLIQHYSRNISNRYLAQYKPHLSLFSSTVDVETIKNYIDDSFVKDQGVFLFDIAITNSVNNGEVTEVLFE